MGGDTNWDTKCIAHNESDDCRKHDVIKQSFNLAG